MQHLPRRLGWVALLEDRLQPVQSSLAELRGMERISIEALRSTACAQSLASFKQPRDERVLKEFPRVTLGKASKAKLRALVSRG
jgi:non-ribosomal peptide synthetase component E (peptide arylation enzyme)